MVGYTVLMSVYYKEIPAFLQTAIESMLNQTVAPEQFVLVCDGPLTQELDAVIAGYEERAADVFTVLRLPKNMGLGVALQKGLELCRCDLVARMDADDIAVPDRMEKQLKLLRDRPEVCVVGGQIAEFSESPEIITDYRTVPETAQQIRKWVRSRNPMNHMTVTFRKSEVLAAGGYQSVLWFEDYHLWVRMLARNCAMANLPEVMCNVRVDRDLYKRRGGVAYFQNTLTVEKLLLSSGMVSIFRYGWNIVVRFISAVVLGSSLRSCLYGKVLRKKRLQNMPEGGE